MIRWIEPQSICSRKQEMDVIKLTYRGVNITHALLMILSNNWGQQTIGVREQLILI